jgi:hypothetical protein
MDTSSSSSPSLSRLSMDQDVQYSLNELLSQVEILVEQQQQQQQPSSIMKKQRKKCHGNHKRRRFKKKCRRKGMNEEEIAKLIDEYDHRHNTNQTIEIENNAATTTVEVTTNVENMEITTESNKRKRMTTSLSHQSLLQALPTKKMKAKQQQQQQIIISTTNNDNTRLPLYLKLLPNLIFKVLRSQLKYPLNDKQEQTFIYNRLQMFDQHFRLDLHQNLWQTYLTIGTKQQLWPVSIENIIYYIYIFFFNFFQI